MKPFNYLRRLFSFIMLVALIFSLATCKKSETVEIPTVTTKIPSSITVTSASVGGFVSSDGGSTVTERGVCYSIHQNPSVSDFSVISGGGIGNFECDIIGLVENTKYYIRAYALNSAGVGYANQLDFITNITGTGTPPTITTNAISNLTQSTAICGGNVTAQGSSNITARGVCWSTSQNPTISDTYTTDGTGIGSFISSITGLVANTQYYARAYATNADGTGYGNQVAFKNLISLSLSNHNGSIEPNSIIIQSASIFSSDIVTYISVTNTNNHTIKVLCKKSQLTMLDSTEIVMCWGGGYYPPLTNISLYPETIAAGQTYTDNAGVGHYNQIAFQPFRPGESLVRWVFFDKENSNDSACVTIRYITN